MNLRPVSYSFAVALILSVANSLSAATTSASANFSLAHGVSVSTGLVSILGSTSNAASTSTSVTLPQFAAASGTLTSVSVSVTTTPSNFNAGKTGVLTLLSSGTLSSTLKANVTAGAVARNAQDNVTVSGTALVTLLGGPLFTPGAAVNTTFTITDPTELAAFIGNGTVGASLTADDSVSINTLASVLSGVGLTSSGTYSGHVDVTYSYTAPAAVSAPSIGSQPSALNLSVGGTITLSVTAGGTGPFTYQWSKTGLPIAGATSSTLTISNASLLDSGAYTVVVTNSGGSTTSSAALVVVAALPSGGSSGGVSAPSISSQPTALTLSAGGSITLSVGAGGTGPFTYQWYKNSLAVSGATASTLTINNATIADSGSFYVVVTNAGGSTTSSTAAVVVLAAPTVNTAPAIGSQPTSQTVTAGNSVTFGISSTGTAPFTYQWRRNGNAIAGATNTSITIAAAQSSDAGAYSVVVTNPYGSVTSLSATLTVQASVTTPGANGGSTTAPAITSGPTSQTVPVGANVNFSVTASGQTGLTYQWLKNGIALLGATGSSYGLTNVQPSDAGDFSVIVQNVLGNAISSTATLTVTGVATKAVAPAARLVNLSTRSNIGTGADILIGGFVIGGNSDQTFLIRGVGPSLAQLGLSGVLADPKVTIYKGDKIVASSQDWSNAADVAKIKQWTAATGAFALLDNSRDDALLATLSPGAYTVMMEGVNGDTGQGLIEFYNLSTGSTAALGSDIVNLSSRGRVTKDNPVIAGFVIGGDSPKAVMIRGVGPSLAKLGVTNPLANPMITLYRGSDVVKWNGDWDSGNDPAAVRRVANAVGAFPLDPSSKDAVILISLDPGTYTAVISGDDGSEGVALVEIYQAY